MLTHHQYGFRGRFRFTTPISPRSPYARGTPASRPTGAMIATAISGAATSATACQQAEAQVEHVLPHRGIQVQHREQHRRRDGRGQERAQVRHGPGAISAFPAHGIENSAEHQAAQHQLLADRRGHGDAGDDQQIGPCGLAQPQLIDDRLRRFNARRIQQQIHGDGEDDGDHAHVQQTLQHRRGSGRVGSAADEEAVGETGVAVGAAATPMNGCAHPRIPGRSRGAAPPFTPRSASRSPARIASAIFLTAQA